MAYTGHDFFKDNEFLNLCMKEIQQYVKLYDFLKDQKKEKQNENH